jgi:hypothetical protein
MDLSFVHGRSCTIQLLTVFGKITEKLDQGGTVDMVYLDFAKDCYTVPHKRLLAKLEGYGVKGELMAWKEHFLVGIDVRRLELKQHTQNADSSQPDCCSKLHVCHRLTA